MTKTLKVFEHEDPHVVARKFCLENDLDDSVCDYLVEKIRKGKELANLKNAQSHALL
jgi:hypothetical protein